MSVDSGQYGTGGPGGHDMAEPHAPPGVALFNDTCRADNVCLLGWPSGK
jgi:hypothetical protein